MELFLLAAGGGITHPRRVERQGAVRRNARAQAGAVDAVPQADAGGRAPRAGAHVILALLEGDARDKTFWGDRAAVTALADHLRTPQVTTTVVDDTEHQALAVEMADKSAGYNRPHRLDLDFVTTAEFRTLLGSYQEIRDLMKGPVTIRTSAAAARRLTTRRPRRHRRRRRPPNPGARQRRTSLTGPSSRSTISSSTSWPPAAAA
jgi:hypothetical protein